MEVHRLAAEYAGRLDAALAAALPDLSRVRLQRLIAAGHCTVDGVVARKPSHQVATGSAIEIEVPPIEHIAPDVAFDLPVLYEDSALTVIDKPAGLAVHGAPGDEGPCVATWWLVRLGADASSFDAERPGIVHRLDKDTTGVLVLAKTPKAQAALSAAFEARATDKTYIAVCDGHPPRERAVIDAPIARHPGDRTRMAIVRKGRASRTNYEVLASDKETSLVLVKPETGRTHQIRVHLDGVGAPVRFDKVYGRPGPGRQLLHAWRITVPHPEGGTLTVTAPLPPDMCEAVRTMGAETVALPYTMPCEANRAEGAPA
ncbi:MAG TPA: RluA family pseudouridine synthase [Tepidiformaceae bacterium]|nr:RluA family pseudouridine synthase [Tepidiformaceae bacterium]